MLFARKMLLLSCLLGVAWAATGPRLAAADDLLHKDALRRVGGVNFRGSDGILSLAYSPNGKILASGGRNDPVRLWNAADGQLLRTLPEHWVWAIAFSPDGAVVATGGANKVVRLWNVETGKEIKQLKGHKATIKTLAFSSDGSGLVSAGDDGIVRLWKAADGSEVAAYQGHTFGVNAAAIAPDTKSLASGGTDRTIRIWNGKQEVLSAPSAITGITYLPDRKSLITTGDDGFVRVWNLAGGKEARAWKGHADTITHMVLSEDGKTLATAGADKFVKTWDVDKGLVLQSIARKLGDGDALALTRDAKQVAAGGFNNTIRRWNAVTGAALSEEGVPEGAVTSVACSPRGDLVAAGYSTNQVALLDMNGREKHRLVCAPEDSEVLLAFAGDGRTLATASGLDTLVLWNVATGKETRRFAQPDRAEMRCLACSPDGKHLAVGHTTGLRIWKTGSGAVVKMLPAPRGARAVAYSADGKTLAVGLEDSLVFYDTGSYQVVRQYDKLNDTVACLAFAPDGRTLAAGTFANSIRLFDLTQPADKKDVEPRILDGHLGVVNALAWSANGRCLASAGFDKTVRYWEFVNGQPIASWTGHGGEATGVALHPSGRLAISGSRDTTLLFWDATCLGQGGKLPPAQEMTTAALDALWKTLASDANARGNDAMWTLIAAKDNVAYLSKKVFLTDPTQIKKYLLDLNSDKFAIREKATAALASYERWIEGVLKSALENPPSEEARQRLDKLLQRLVGKEAITLQQERLRARRVIEVLEQTATPEARTLLEKMGAGAAEEDLRIMAQAAFERLSKR